MINARGETVAEKPSFRSAFKNRRCLILADGYFEWESRGPGRPKQPYYITLADEQPFAMAGIWETWRSPEGDKVETCSIITTNANELTQPIHDRMPVVLQPSDYPLWLNVRQTDRNALEALLSPYPANRMRFTPVDTIVNNPRNETEKCIEAADDAE